MRGRLWEMGDGVAVVEFGDVWAVVVAERIEVLVEEDHDEGDDE